MFAVILALVPVPQGSPDAAPVPYFVPYRLTDTQHLLVRAKVNGKGPFNFLIDTGAPTVFLSPKIAKSAGITPDKEQWGKITTLDIEGGTTQKNVAARIEEVYQMQGMNAMGLAGSRIDGIFGYTLLSQYKMGIDLGATTMTWTPTPFDSLKFLEASRTRAGNFKPPKQAAADLAQMQRMAKWASAMFPGKAEKEIVRRAFFGMEIADAKNGAQVTAVLSGSPAETAGLKVGDRITHAAATSNTEPVAVASASALLTTLADVVPAQSITLTIWRGTAKSRLTLTGTEGL